MVLFLPVHIKHFYLRELPTFTFIHVLWLNLFYYNLYRLGSVQSLRGWRSPSGTKSTSPRSPGTRSRPLPRVEPGLRRDLGFISFLDLIQKITFLPRHLARENIGNVVFFQQFNCTIIPERKWICRILFIPCY